MTGKDDFINDFISQFSPDGRHDKFVYHCNKCGYELERIVVKTIAETPRKLFYCARSSCDRFGLVTVVAKKKAKL